MNTDINQNKKQMLLSGTALFVFALFGLGKELDLIKVLTWIDGIVICMASAAAVSYVKESKWLYTLLTVIAVGVFLSYQHKWVILDLGVTLFATLLLVGSSMVLKGLRWSQ